MKPFQRLQKLIYDQKCKGVMHNCGTCSWFKPKPNPPMQGNRNCFCPYKNERVPCQNWHLQPDKTKWVSVYNR